MLRATAFYSGSSAFMPDDHLMSGTSIATKAPPCCAQHVSAVRVRGDQPVERTKPNAVRAQAAFLEPRFGEKLQHLVGFGRMAFNGGLTGDHPDHAGPCLFHSQQANLVPQFFVAQPQALQVADGTRLTAIRQMTKAVPIGRFDHQTARFTGRRKPNLMLITEGIGRAVRLLKTPQASRAFSPLAEGLTLGRKLCRTKKASTSANCFSACSRFSKGDFERA